LQSEGLSQAALDPVADHGRPDGARNSEPDAGACGRPAGFARLAEGGEQRTGDAESVIINMPEIGGAQDPGRPGEASLAAGGISRRERGGRLFRRSRSACAVRERAAATAPPGRPWSPSWSEIRASWRAFDYSVETFFWAC
jgi:hypothetical protein